MSHIETEPLLVNSWVGMGREMESRTGNWNLNVLSHMCYIKTVREKKRKVGKQKGFADVVSNLLKQISCSGTRLKHAPL